MLKDGLMNNRLTVKANIPFEEIDIEDSRGINSDSYAHLLSLISR